MVVGCLNNIHMGSLIERRPTFAPSLTTDCTHSPLMRSPCSAFLEGAGCLLLHHQGGQKVQAS